jgi:hypothetical protein
MNRKLRKDLPSNVKAIIERIDPYIMRDTVGRLEVTEDVGF